MADQSWLDFLGGVLGSGAEASGDVLRGLYNDFNPDTPFDTGAARIADRTSEYWTGIPITPRQESLVSPGLGINSVDVGVSPGEQEKALTKIAEAQAEQEKIRQQSDLLNNQRLEQLIKQSRAQPSDVFSADSNGIIRGDGSPMDSGSYSKSLKPIASYDKSENDAQDLKKAGIPSGVADYLAKLGAESDQKRNVSQEAALRMLSNSGLKLNGPQLSDAQKELMTMIQLIKTDKLNAPRYARRILQILGKSEDEINAIYGKKK